MNQTNTAMNFRQYSRSIIIRANDDNIQAWDSIFADVDGFAEFYDQTEELFQVYIDAYVSCDTGILFDCVISGWNNGDTPDQVAKDLADGYCEAQYEDYVSNFYSY